MSGLMESLASNQGVRRYQTRNLAIALKVEMQLKFLPFLVLIWCHESWGMVPSRASRTLDLGRHTHSHLSEAKSTQRITQDLGSSSAVPPQVLDPVTTDELHATTVSSAMELDIHGQERNQVSQKPLFQSKDSQLQYGEPQVVDLVRSTTHENVVELVRESSRSQGIRLWGKTMFPGTKEADPEELHRTPHQPTDKSSHLPRLPGTIPTLEPHHMELDGGQSTQESEIIATIDLALISQFFSGELFGDPKSGQLLTPDKQFLAQIQPSLEVILSRLVLFKRLRNERPIRRSNLVRGLAFSMIPIKEIVARKAWDYEMPLYVFREDYQTKTTIKQNPLPDIMTSIAGQEHSRKYVHELVSLASIVQPRTRELIKNEEDLSDIELLRISSIAERMISFKAHLIYVPENVSPTTKVASFGKYCGNYSPYVEESLQVSNTAQSIIWLLASHQGNHEAKSYRASKELKAELEKLKDVEEYKKMYELTMEVMPIFVYLNRQLHRFIYSNSDPKLDENIKTWSWNFVEEKAIKMAKTACINNKTGSTSHWDIKSELGKKFVSRYVELSMSSHGAQCSWYAAWSMLGIWATEKRRPLKDFINQNGKWKRSLTGLVGQSVLNDGLNELYLASLAARKTFL